MGRELENQFSWSKSRHERLTECQRAYYFQYYASWGGWKRDAPARARELWLLKKLSNRFTWAGSVVHAVAQRALLDIRAGREVNQQASIDAAHRQMREDFRHSRARAYHLEKGRKDFWGLVEHEYGETIDASTWRANWEATRQAIEGFFASGWLDLARRLKPEQWLEVDDQPFDEAAFVWDGVRVFAIPDFAYLEDDGSAVVVDWKTGKPRDGYDEQLLCYAIYVSRQYGVPLEKVRCRLVYLSAGTERDILPEPAAIERVTGVFRDSVATMRSLLEDAEQNRPRPEEAFARIEEGATCARCPYRRPCGREAKRVQRPRLDEVAAA